MRLYWQKRRIPDDVVAPKYLLDLGQVTFVEVCAGGGGLEVNAPDANVERVLLRVDGDVRTEAAQLMADLVADVAGDDQHGCGDGGSQGDSRDREQLAAALPEERLVDEAREHAY